MEPKADENGADPFSRLETALPFGPGDARVLAAADEASEEFSRRLAWWMLPKNNRSLMKLFLEMPKTSFWTTGGSMRMSRVRAVSMYLAWIVIAAASAAILFNIAERFWPDFSRDQSIKRYFRLAAFLASVYGWAVFLAVRERKAQHARLRTRCRACGYNCKGLSLPVSGMAPRASILGPLNCPECGEKWPIVPPPIPGSP